MRWSAHGHQHDRARHSTVVSLVSCVLLLVSVRGFEMDDFIDDSDAKCDYSAEIRKIFK